jgi:hypothetical protein
MMIFNIECPVCGMDLPFVDSPHSAEECAGQQTANAKARADHEARNRAWDEKVARLRVDGKPLPPLIRFPATRVVTPTMWQHTVVDEDE